jgi:hypothetical protein
MLVMVAGATCAALAAVTAWQWRLAQAASANGEAWALALAGMGLALATGVWAWVQILRGLTDCLAGCLDERLADSLADPGRNMHPMPGVWLAWQQRGTMSPLMQAAAWVHLAWLALLAMQALQVVFDGRYRELLWPLMVATAVLTLAWRACGTPLHASAREERALGALLACLAPLIVWQEGWVNAQAWTTVAACAAAAWSTRWLQRATAHDDDPGARQSGSNSAGHVTRGQKAGNQ